MTDTTAPRTAAPLSRAEFQRVVEALDGFDTGWHESRADFVADLLAHIEPRGLTIVNREAIEPLLALVRAAQEVVELGPGRVSVDSVDALNRLGRTFRALPESIRAAARKPE